MRDFQNWERPPERPPWPRIGSRVWVDGEAGRISYVGLVRIDVVLDDGRLLTQVPGTRLQSQPRREAA